MEWSLDRDERTRKISFKLEMDVCDMERARLSEFELLEVRLLEDQQLQHPTVEGALMILQLFARAIERDPPGWGLLSTSMGG